MDVVPPGDLTAWETPPFEPTVRDNTLYARGAADMKGGLCATLCAARTFLKQHPDFEGSISFLITGDEEKDSTDGTPALLEELKKQNETIDVCLLAEPTCDQNLGDGLKVGRRGSAHFTCTINGLQHHAAYPYFKKNSVLIAATLAQHMATFPWDEKAPTPDTSGFFPPTHLSLVGLESPLVAFNVTPPTAILHANIRYNPSYTAESLEKQVRAQVQNVLATFDQAVSYDISFTPQGDAFCSSPNGKGIKATRQAIKSVVGITPDLNGRGGTSDARFICHYAQEVFEFGPINSSIHQPNENLPLHDYANLIEIYIEMLKNFFTTKTPT